MNRYVIKLVKENLPEPVKYRVRGNFISGYRIEYYGFGPRILLMTVARAVAFDAIKNSGVKYPVTDEEFDNSNDPFHPEKDVVYICKLGLETVIKAALSQCASYSKLPANPEKRKKAEDYEKLARKEALLWGPVMLSPNIVEKVSKDKTTIKECVKANIEEALVLPSEYKVYIP